MDGSEKLERDLVVLEAMAGEMDEYLRSDVLFWPLRGKRSTSPDARRLPDAPAPAARAP
jgi:hypothetical protein